MAVFRSLLVALVALTPLGFASEALAQSAVPIVTSSCGSQSLTATRNASPYEDTTGKACVNATVSASVGGFTPSASGARMTPLSVTTSDSSGTLPTGTVVVVSNVGTNPEYCNVNGVAATTSDELIPASSWFAFTIPAAITTLHCIATGGSTTSNGVGGAGLATGSGGGSGGGGGGGGAITAASGSYAAGAFSAGVAVSGSFLTGSIVDLGPLITAQGASTAGLKGPLTQCAVTTAAPTYTTAQTDPFSCDTAGNLRVNVVAGGAGGGAVFGPTAVGSAVANPPVVNGFQDGSGNVAVVTPTVGLPVNVVAGSLTGTLSPATTTTTNGSGTITTGGTFQSILASSGTRKGCLVQNPTTATEPLYVYFGATGSATVGNSISLAPGASVNCTVSGLLIATDNIAATATTTSHAYTEMSQ